MATKFMEMRKRIEVLERLDATLDSMEKDVLYSYECVKETVTDRQKTHWKTGELLWKDEEHTIPEYVVEREYDYVKKETLDEEDELMAKTIEDIRKALLKLV